MNLEEIGDRTLTTFKKTKAESGSVYFKLFTYCIRMSDHLAKHSDGLIQIVTIEDKILFWKCVQNPNQEIKKNIIQKFVTEDELLDILTVINNSAKYFVP